MTTGKKLALGALTSVLGVGGVAGLDLYLDECRPKIISVDTQGTGAQCDHSEHQARIYWARDRMRAHLICYCGELTQDIYDEQ
jgi:hypothetical protein